MRTVNRSTSAEERNLVAHFLLTFSQVVEKSHQTSLVLIEPPELGRVQRLAVDPDYPLARRMLPGEHDDHCLGLVLVVSTLELHPPPRWT